MLKDKFFLFLNLIARIYKKGRKNKNIPVGFVKKTNPNEIPDKIEYIKFFVSLKYHFVKISKFKVLKEVSDKSIR